MIEQIVQTRVEDQTAHPLWSNMILDNLEEQPEGKRGAIINQLSDLFEKIYPKKKRATGAEKKALADGIQQLVPGMKDFSRLFSLIDNKTDEQRKMLFEFLRSIVRIIGPERAYEPPRAAQFTKLNAIFDEFHAERATFHEGRVKDHEERINIYAERAKKTTSTTSYRKRHTN